MKSCSINASRSPDVGHHARRRTNLWSHSSSQIRLGTSSAASFTLLELLVVVAIIGILAAIGLPRLSGFGKSNAMIAATRQLLDDIGYARSLAIANRADVYMVFVPESRILPDNFFTSLPPGASRTLATNLMGKQFTTYALYSERTVGDQPGHREPHYLTAWESLPQGIFIPPRKLFTMWFNGWPDVDRPLRFGGFPFPLATNARQKLCYLAFDFQGRLVSEGSPFLGYRDAIIPLARGSIFYDRYPNGLIKPDSNGHIIADVLENPPGNSSRTNTTWNDIHIDWLAGRARLERQEVAP